MNLAADRLRSCFACIAELRGALMRVRVALAANAVLVAAALFCNGVAAQTYSSFGTFTWTAPSGVTSVVVEAWGAGGAGGGARGNPSVGGGGAGGQYAKRTMTVVPGNAYSVGVGAGGTGSTSNGNTGGDSSFNGTSVVAKGGAGGSRMTSDCSGGNGGSGSSSSSSGPGSTVYAGGSGSKGAIDAPLGCWLGWSNSGGAGGGGAGGGGAGGSASGSTAGVGTANGGGDGAPGTAVGGAGAAGNAAGGGGAGGFASDGNDQAGGDGGAGRVVVSRAPSVTTTDATSVVRWTATLNGTVAYGGPTSAYFQYGTSSGSYGALIPASPTDLDPSGTNASISLSLSNLSCETTYYFRAYATNAAGEQYGNEKSFTTPQCAVIRLGKSGPSSGLVNNYISFVITATNANAQSALSNIEIYDDIPASYMVYSSHAAGLGVASLSGSLLTWKIGYLPANTTAQLTLVVKLTARGKATNTVTSPGAPSASADVFVLPGGVVHYRMDEAAGSWNGTTGEVLDIGSKHLNGTRTTITAPTTTNTVAPNPTIVSQKPAVVGGGFCNAGSFDGKAVIKTPSDPFFQFTTTLSASAWIYPTSYPSATDASANNNLYSILSNDSNYEFHINSDGKLYWWWQFPPNDAYLLNSTSVIEKNKWTHVAITFDSSSNRQRIYINGVLDASRTLPAAAVGLSLKTNPCPMYVGGDIGTTFPQTDPPTCNLIQARAFKGLIDETKIYEYELSSDEVMADLTQGRLCSGTFDHVRIEYSGKLSKCSAKTVTVKACMDTGCTSYYPGPVAVTLTPTGWLPQDAITIMNGVTQATLPNSVVSGATMTLGGTNVNPAPNNNPKVRCFNDATESCVVQVDASPCTANFDAVEVGANPNTHLYTKLAGTDFDVDLLALVSGSPTTVDTNYVGAVTYDLVDSTALDTATPTATCKTTSSLSSPAPITFSQADQGRKKISINSGVAIQDGRVRVTLGSSGACSSDNFAVRPPSVTLATTQATPATAPSATDPNTLKAADYNAATGNTLNFTLKASASTGYAGTLILDKTKMSVQDPALNPSGGIAAATTNVGTLITVPLNAGNSTLVGNSASTAVNAAYNEVGYLYLGAGAYLDATFTGVDRAPGDCVTDTASGNNFSNIKNAYGKYGCDVASLPLNIGRFIPDHFETLALGTMDCPAGLVCPTGSGIVYSDQPLTSTASRTPLKIIAASSGGGTTKNYAGYFANDTTLKVVDAAGSSSSTNADNKGALRNIVTLAAAFSETRDSSSIVTKTGGVALASPTYKFTNWPINPTDIYFRATAADSVSSLQSPAASSKEGGVKVVTGRLIMSNATGSEKQTLMMPVEARYWSGLAWVLNSADNSTAFIGDPLDFTKSVFLVAPTTGQLSVAGKTSVLSAQSPLTGGKGSIVLNAPGAHNIGSVDLALDLGTTSSDASCLASHGSNFTAAAVPWLRGACAGGAGETADPSARATFGIYTPENRRQVHVRELY